MHQVRMRTRKQLTQFAHPQTDSCQQPTFWQLRVQQHACSWGHMMMDSTCYLVLGRIVVFCIQAVWIQAQKLPACFRECDAEWPHSQQTERLHTMQPQPMHNLETATKSDGNDARHVRHHQRHGAAARTYTNAFLEEKQHRGLTNKTTQRDARQTRWAVIAGACCWPEQLQMICTTASSRIDVSTSSTLPWCICCTDVAYHRSLVASKRCAASIHFSDVVVALQQFLLRFVLLWWSAVVIRR